MDDAIRLGLASWDGEAHEYFLAVPVSIERRRCVAVSEPDDLIPDVDGMSDAELLDAYQQTAGEPGDPVADALCAEMERRGLDF